MSEPTKPTPPPQKPTPPTEPTAPLPRTEPTEPLPPGAAGGPGYQAGPPPRKPGLFRQATSTTGGTIALVVAGALAALMLLGAAGLASLVVLRAVGQEHREDRLEQARERWDGGLPPGQQKKLDKPPKMPDAPRGRADDGQGSGFGQLMRGALGLGNIQHGEFTVQDDTGKATVMTVQRGSVTASSDTSVSVRSADGFTAKYAVDDATKGMAANVAVGDEVLVVAEKAGAKALMIRPAKLKS